LVNILDDMLWITDAYS